MNPPRGHDVHIQARLAPRMGLYVLIGQSEHLLKCIAVSSCVRSVCLTSVKYIEPRVHRRSTQQFETYPPGPAWLLYVPSRHSEQALHLSSRQNVPAGHGMHSPTTLSAEWPEGQLTCKSRAQVHQQKEQPRPNTIRQSNHEKGIRQIWNKEKQYIESKSKNVKNRKRQKKKYQVVGPTQQCPRRILKSRAQASAQG